MKHVKIGNNMKIIILKEAMGHPSFLNTKMEPYQEIQITNREEMFEPLYEWLHNFFSDDYAEAANQFMFMGAEIPWPDLNKVLYFYKHGMTRKYVITDKQGIPYRLERFSDEKNTYKEITQITYLASFKKVYGDLEQNIKQVHGDSENPYFVSYNSDYIKKRTEFLDKKGIKSVRGSDLLNQN